MTEETMTIRQALGEKKLLDSRISKIMDNLVPTYTYKKDDLFLFGVPVEKYAENIKSTIQSLNDLIARREAISKAILNNNVNSTIAVNPFKNFDTILDQSQEKEYISIAAAIARKAYYKILLTKLRNMKSRNSRIIDDYGLAVDAARNKANSNLVERYASVEKSNIPKNWDELVKAEQERLAPIFCDPANSVEKLDKWIEYLENYINTIDVELSHATDQNTIMIVY